MVSSKMKACHRVAAAFLAATALMGTGAVAAEADRGGAARLLDPAYVAQSLCGPLPQRRTEVFKPGFQMAARAAGSAAATAGPLLRDDLGTLSFKVTTARPEAQRWFDQGLRFAFAFNHAEALRAFKAAQAADPTCAMCYWGEAYALGPNINWPMPAEAVAPAFAATAQAMALRDGASPAERALIGALAVRYAADPAADRAELDRAYADAMTAVAAQHDDDTIQTLFADALMNLQPWDYWAPDKATPKGRTAEQVAALERVLARNPDHPGAIHLYIHTVEATLTPERAEPFADRLGALMPGAGHLVHMPAHIYYRVGRYLDSLNANIAAARADEVLLKAAPAEAGIYRYGYYPHNVHFVLVSAAMAGDAGHALAAAEKLGGITSDAVAKQVSWIEAIKQAPYFAHARFSSPATVLALPAPPATFPYVGVSWRYARALALIRQGDLIAAEAEAEALAEIASRVDHAHLARGLVPSEPVVQIATGVVAARLAQARGDLDTAIRRLEEAAALEEALPYMEPPWWPYPVRQSLGAALLAAGRVEDAARAFQRTLMTAPNNAYALHGLATAQQRMGDDAGAKATRARFEAAWAGGDTLPDLAWM